MSRRPTGDWGEIGATLRAISFCAALLAEWQECCDYDCDYDYAYGYNYNDDWEMTYHNAGRMPEGGKARITYLNLPTQIFDPANIFLFFVHNYLIC